GHHLVTAKFAQLLRHDARGAVHIKQKLRIGVQISSPGGDFIVEFGNAIDNGHGRTKADGREGQCPCPNPSRQLLRCSFFPSGVPQPYKKPFRQLFAPPALHIPAISPYIPHNSVLWSGICSLPSLSVSLASLPVCSWHSPWFRSVMQKPVVAAASAAAAPTLSIRPRRPTRPRARLPRFSAP